MLKIGVAEKRITPPVGVELSGYAFGPSVGILDELYAQALVMEINNEYFIIITSDLIGFSVENVSEIRDRIEQATGIPGDRVMMSCSHTHSGPATMFLRHWGEYDQSYLITLKSILIDLIVEAKSNLREANL